MTAEGIAVAVGNAMVYEVLPTGPPSTPAFLKSVAASDSVVQLISCDRDNATSAL